MMYCDVASVVIYSNFTTPTNARIPIGKVTFLRRTADPFFVFRKELGAGVCIILLVRSLHI